MEIKPIAYIRNDFKEKFGIPRQSGLVDSIRSDIVFEKEYSNPDAFRGLEQYTHIWLIWEFSEAKQENWSPTVRPPRLGGNTRMGVFATRSPYRPNPLGLSCVKIENIDLDNKAGAVITVSGADILNNTPIYDIKPYLPYADICEEASNGFALAQKEGLLKVRISDELKNIFPSEKLDGLIDILSQDPRPQYQNSPERIYTMNYADYDISFSINENILTVTNIIKL